MHNMMEIEAIKRIKYKYLRCVDNKLWDELAECFTDYAVTSFSGGEYSFEGGEAIMSFLKGSLGSHRITQHQVHHPEIELTSSTTATGTWALQDYVIDLKRGTSLFGTAYYHDEYIKVNGDWKIKSTGYERIFDEIYERDDVPSRRLLHNKFSDSK